MREDENEITYSHELAGHQVELPYVADERAMLLAFLDWHRETLRLKCEGVPRERLSERGVPPSTLSLHGLLRHLAGVERWWFRMQFAHEDLPFLYYSEDQPDQDFDHLGGDVEEAFRVWEREVARSREIVAAHSFDDTTALLYGDCDVSLRRVVMQVLIDYARHNGHADLLRERIDGATGY